MEFDAFYEAAASGDVGTVRRILKEHPEIDVNATRIKASLNESALHKACAYGHDEIVTLLLAHPDIDVNQKANGGWTPFMTACANGKTSCVQLLLKDARSS